MVKKIIRFLFKNILQCIAAITVVVLYRHLVTNDSALETERAHITISGFFTLICLFVLFVSKRLLSEYRAVTQITAFISLLGLYWVCFYGSYTGTVFTTSSKTQDQFVVDTTRLIETRKQKEDTLVQLNRLSFSLAKQIDKAKQDITAIARLQTEIASIDTLLNTRITSVNELSANLQQLISMLRDRPLIPESKRTVVLRVGLDEKILPPRRQDSSRFFVTK